MYGSTADSSNEDEATAKSPGEEVPLVEKSTFSINIDDDAAVQKFLKNPYGENWDSAFWHDVTDLFNGGKNISWKGALNQIRIDRIKEIFESQKKLLLLCLFEIYDEFMKHAVNNQMTISFKQQFCEFVKLILKEDYQSTDSQNERSYAWPIEVPNEGTKTILHLGAERDLVDVIEEYLKYYPGHVYEPTSGSGLNRIPLEFALINQHDESATLLIKNMLHERVRDLFQSDEAFDARFKFAEIIQNPAFKKTVIAILDCCVNADWPYIPVEESEKKELAWSRIVDTPTRYHFYYRLLDGDLNSEPAKLKNGEPNPEFNHRTPSCLQLLIEGCHSEMVITHPVIRMLANRKWEKFGRTQIRNHFIAYIIFLIFMSVAFFIDHKTTSPAKYEDSVGYLRAVFEIVTLLFSLFYLISEIDQMEKERWKYWKDIYNYFDLAGILLMFILVPLRFSDVTRAGWTVAAIAYLFNFLRVFKYFPAFKQIGIYSKTFAQIIYYDISKFFLIYSIVMVAFTGSLYLLLKASVTDTTKRIGFFSVMLREVRALAEGNPFQDDYDGLHAAVVIFIMINMFTIIVILSNILIGQLSYRYEMAINEAEIQHSIDKTKFITKLERSRFLAQNMRIAHYIEGDYVGADDLVSALLEDWLKVKESGNENSREKVREILDDCISVKEKQD